MSSVLNDAIRALLDSPRNHGILATVHPDGSPQSSVVWVGREGDEVVISTQAGRRKEKNIRHEPRVSLTVHDVSDPDLYVELRGKATVTEDTGRRVAVALAEKYAGPGAGEAYLALPPEAVRVVIRFTPTHATGAAA